MEARKKILVAPMNWGLGHAARCVPVIRELLLRNAEVIIAADGRALQLLRNEFPELKWIRLPGYNIKYWWEGSATFQIFLQLPKVIAAFYSERKWLKKFIEEEKIDAVISDNRYGLYSKKIPCIFITHQICIQLPKGFKWMEKFVYQLNKKFIERFDECWIPDFIGEKNLTGDLVHKYPRPRTSILIDPLSRFSYQKKQKERDVLIVISGPEKQRTRFEEMLTRQAKELDLVILMVRGIPGSNGREEVTENFTKVDFLNSEELNSAFLSSEIIVARSGYSTIMDLAVTRNRAIVIPTPGQTEQEYLARKFNREKIFFSQPQKNFNLKNALIGATPCAWLNLKIHNTFFYSQMDDLFGAIETGKRNLLQPTLPKSGNAPNEFPA